MARKVGLCLLFQELPSGAAKELLEALDQADLSDDNEKIQLQRYLALSEQAIAAVAEAKEDYAAATAALEAGGLVDTLKADGPYTVFAPTDEAFAKLPDGTVEMLLLPENKDKLVEILTYHVVAGKVTAAEVVTLESATTANGSDVAIRVVDETVFINDSRVVATDIGASNGVIHVVDTVILPN